MFLELAALGGSIIIGLIWNRTQVKKTWFQIQVQYQDTSQKPHIMYYHSPVTETECEEMDQTWSMIIGTPAWYNYCKQWHIHRMIVENSYRGVTNERICV